MRRNLHGHVLIPTASAETPAFCNHTKSRRSYSPARCPRSAAVRYTGTNSEPPRACPETIGLRVPAVAGVGGGRSEPSRLRRAEVVAVLEGSAVVVPVDPFGGGDFEVVEAVPGPPGLDQLGLVEPDHGLGQRVVERRPDSSDRGLDLGCLQPLGVSQRQVLAAVVVMSDQPGQFAAVAMSGPDCLVNGVEDQLVGHRGGHRPAEDPAGVGVDNERGVAQPDHVETYVNSDTHSRSGASGAKFRSTKSTGFAADRSGMVVRLTFPRTAPRRPSSPIRRSTVHRAIGGSPAGRSRFRVSHTFRAP